jgi:hypothetical protein
MKRYRVWLVNGTEVVIECDHFRVLEYSGALEFCKKEDESEFADTEIIVAYNPGAWVSVIKES